MPDTRKTQSFTVTLSTNELERDLQNHLAAALTRLNPDIVQSSHVATSEPEITSVETEAEKASTAARDAKLLELKGWLFGEHLKKEAGLPSEWDQGSWGAQTSCGTSCCIAGKTVLDAGGKFVKVDHGSSWMDGGMTFADPGPDDFMNFSWVRMPDGSTVKVADRAQELLGLDTAQKGALFEGDNTYAMAAAVIDAIIAGEEDPYVARAEARR